MIRSFIAESVMTLHVASHCCITMIVLTGDTNLFWSSVSFGTCGKDVPFPDCITEWICHGSHAVAWNTCGIFCGSGRCRLSGLSQMETG